MANLYSSAKAYFGFAVEGTPGTDPGGPTGYLLADRSQSKFEWTENLQEEDLATSDYFTTVDGIPIQPHSTGTIAVPFFPTILNTFLAANCMPGGALVPPASLSFYIGNGLDETIYSGCQVATAKMSVAGSQKAMWTFSYQGTEKAVTHARRTPSLPTYERPYLLSNLGLATLIGSSGVSRFESVEIEVITATVLEYLSRGDGVNAASDVVLNKLGGAATFKRAYNSATEKAAFLAECGTLGVITFPFTTTCGGSHSHTFSFPNAIYRQRQEDSPNDGYTSENLVVLAERNPGGSPSPLTLAIA